MQTGSHPSPFKGYAFGICPECGHKTVYKGIVRNPASPSVYVRCRYCGAEDFADTRPDLKVI
jgi:uncharacterized Zn finger protein